MQPLSLSMDLHPACSLFFSFATRRITYGNRFHHDFSFVSKRSKKNGSLRLLMNAKPGCRRKSEFSEDVKRLAVVRIVINEVVLKFTILLRHQRASSGPLTE